MGKKVGQMGGLDAKVDGLSTRIDRVLRPTLGAEKQGSANTVSNGQASAHFHAHPHHPMTARPDKPGDPESSSLAEQRPSPTRPAVGWPVLVVGLPKAGTSSIADFSRCAGVTTSHFQCTYNVSKDGRIVEKTQPCGECVRDRVNEGRLPLDGCGDYDVWAQMDNCCTFPQTEHLEGLHTEFPNATLILNLRDVAAWVGSVQRWQGGRYVSKLQRVALPHLNIRRGAFSRAGGAELARWPGAQADLVRAFVAKHPSHRLIELHVDHPGAGAQMAGSFGIDETCWTHANANPPPNRR